MFSVTPYSRDALVDACVQDHEHLTAVGCAQNDHTLYLQEYLEEISCKTILREGGYVDRDYLIDYANYYARCFQHYKRKCVRIHFFSREVTEEQLEQMLDGSIAGGFSTLQDYYLGFTVVKPLPVRFYGRTCLVAYPEQEGREYPCLRKYDVNIAGDQLELMSLAFQEQDREVSACATSAIWSALHKTAHEFGYHIPTPSEITTLADESSTGSQRNIPNNGLTAQEIRQAVKNLNLELEVFPVPDLDAVKRVLYAYLSFGLPAILGYNLKTQNGTVLGGHAVTAAGYCMDWAGQAPAERSSRINKIYLHDDQAGPFSSARVTAGGRLETKFAHPDRPVSAVPLGGEDDLAAHYLVMVPVYPKIRINVEEALLYLRVLVDLFHRLQLNIPSIEWEVRLTSNGDYKSEIAGLDGMQQDIRRIRAAALPKYMWLIRANVAEGSLFDILLDATSIRDANLLATSLFYDKQLQAQSWDRYFSNSNVIEALEIQYTPRYVEAIATLFRPVEITGEGEDEAAVPAYDVA